MKFEEALEQVKLGNNPSGISPIQYRVVVLDEEIEETTESGLIIKPASTVEQDEWAQTFHYVVAVSDMAFTNDGEAWRCKIPVVGDKVLCRKYPGQKVPVENAKGLTFRVIKDEDILGVIG